VYVEGEDGGNKDGGVKPAPQNRDRNEDSGIKPLLRVAREEDLGRVREILAASPEAAGWTAAALEESLRAHPREFLAAEHGEEIVGFIVGRQVLDEGEILNLAVSPGWRHRGVGERLVLALLDRLGEGGVGRVFLEVRESNAEAIRFYTGLGFGRVGERAGYYREPVEDAVILAWKKEG
jgi:[ribosomal protein S18]-alanine N-acetyltransferase